MLTTVMSMILKRTIWLMLFLHSSSSSDFTPEIPEECEERGICENVSNYPYHYISQILANKADGFVWQPAAIDVEENVTDNAEKELYDYFDMCPSYTNRMKPKAVRDQNGTWRFVINAMDGSQVISVDSVYCRKDVRNQTCGSCTDIKAQPYIGYRVICEEETSLYILPGLDGHGNPIIVKFNNPACCTCLVYKD